MRFERILTESLGKIQHICDVLGVFWYLWLGPLQDAFHHCPNPAKLSLQVQTPQCRRPDTWRGNLSQYLVSEARQTLGAGTLVLLDPYPFLPILICSTFISLSITVLLPSVRMPYASLFFPNFFVSTKACTNCSNTLMPMKTCWVEHVLLET